MICATLGCCRQPAAGPANLSPSLFISLHQLLGSNQFRPCQALQGVAPEHVEEQLALLRLAGSYLEAQAQACATASRDKLSG